MLGLKIGTLGDRVEIVLASCEASHIHVDSGQQSLKASLVRTMEAVASCE